MKSKRYSILSVITVLAFLSLNATAAVAQDSVKNLSLQQAIQEMLNNNSGIRQAKFDEGIANANYKQTDAIFLPQVGVSYSAMTTNDPLNAFGFKLQQRSITANDFNPDLLNQPDRTSNFLAKVEVQQPLVNIDMLYMRKGAQLQTQVYRYKTERTKEYLIFEVQKAYLQLQLAYNGVRVVEESLQNVKSVYTFTDNYFKQGLLQKSDLLNVQVKVTTVESNLAKAQSNVKNASDYLSLLMGQQPTTIYKTVDETQMATQSLDKTLKISGSRLDFMAMNKAIDAYGMMIKSSKMSYLPKLNAFGNYQYNDRQLTGFGANSYFAGLQLSWDVFKGNKTKNTITVQTLERDKLSEQLAQQRDQSQLELNKAYRDLADASFEIEQNQLAIEQASESLRILKNRYQQGLVNTTDVLMAQTQLSQQEFALAQAKFTFGVTNFYIQFLTSTSTK